MADQLADVGMEAIHPKASKPLEIHNIPIRIKNAFDPGHSGTLITKDFIAPQSMVEIVTGSDKVVCLEIHDTRMVGEVGFDLRILQVLAAHQVSYISKATNANTIGMILNERDCTPELVVDLEEHLYVADFAAVAEQLAAACLLPCDPGSLYICKHISCLFSGSHLTAKLGRR